MTGKVDVLIVGGGVAGLATAIHLGRAGLRVTLLEQTPLPRDKVCGEGLMPWGLSLLGRLGVDPAALQGCDFTGLAYRTAHRAALLDLPGEARGRGMPRTVLIEALDRAAASLPTVRQVRDRARSPLVEGTGAERRIVGVQGVRGEYRAGAVVAADGVHSGLARLAGAVFHARGERYALRRHFRSDAGEPWRGADGRMRVGVGLVREGRLAWDLYLTPVGRQTLLATTMTDAAGLRAIGEDYAGFLARSPFSGWLAGAQGCSRQLGWRHPLFVPERYHVGGMLLVGDAGGGTDPCLGVGMTLALAGAEEAGRMLPRLLDGAGSDAARREALEGFDRGRKKLFQHFSAFDNIFRLLIRSRAGGDILVGGMRHWPEVADALLAIIGAGTPWSEFPWPALLRPRLVGRGGVDGLPPLRQGHAEAHRKEQANKERG